MGIVEQRIIERLKIIRREKQLSGKAVSELAGVRPNTITEMERGLHSMTLKTLERICDAYGVEIWKLALPPEKPAGKKVGKKSKNRLDRKSGAR